MKAIQDTTALVLDGGLFVELAVRLARPGGFGRVLYQCSIDQPFPKVHEAAIGEGLEGIETTADFWPLLDEIDIIIFPDCSHAGLQENLIRQGKAVWGSRQAVDLELKRLMFKDVLKEIGLPVGPFHVCKGLTALRKFISKKEDRFIKLSKYRGNTETRHWRDWDTSSDLLDEFAITFGAVAEQIEFIVEERIDTEIEWGLDTYFCGKNFPSIVAHGPETKDKAYAASVVEWKDLPEPILEVATAIAPVLARYNYANFWSMEVRVAKDGTPYFTDPTCRMPSPAGAAQMEFWSNLPEIILYGAHGILIQPEPDATSAVEAIIDHTGDEERWRRLKIPAEQRRWIKLYSACQVDGVYAMPPLAHSWPAIGTLLGMGDDLEEAIDSAKETELSLVGQPVSCHVDDLTDTIEELHTAEESGIELNHEPLPEPEVVIQK